MRLLGLGGACCNTHHKQGLAGWWGVKCEVEACRAYLAGLTCRVAHDLAGWPRGFDRIPCASCCSAKWQQPPADWRRRLLHVLIQMGLGLSCTWPSVSKGAGGPMTRLLVLPAEEQGADLQLLRERGVQAWRRVPVPARDADLWAIGKAEHQGQVTATARHALSMLSVLACLPPAVPCWTAHCTCISAPCLQCYRKTAIKLCSQSWGMLCCCAGTCRTTKRPVSAGTTV